MHKGKYQCHMAANCTYHLPSPSCSTRAIQTKPNWMKNIWVFPGKKSRENGPLREKNDEIKRARGLGRKTRGEGTQGALISHPLCCSSSHKLTKFTTAWSFVPEGGTHGRKPEELCLFLFFFKLCKGDVAITISRHAIIPDMNNQLTYMRIYYVHWF